MRTASVGPWIKVHVMGEKKLCSPLRFIAMGSRDDTYTSALNIVVLAMLVVVKNMELQKYQALHF